MSTPTLNSPDRNELRAEIEHMFESAWQDGVHHLNPKYVRRDSIFTERTMRLIDSFTAALQQTIEAGLPGKLNMDDAMLNHGWTDEEYIAWNTAVRNCQATITKAFEAAKAEKDSK